ncbi:MAG: L-aspartate oxidase, partial [Betaproteobacteria bacterium]|nr:L-aspartate oxidase [Betaproteobacteria bacterium]
MHQFDVVVIGSGLAGLATALSLADQRRVAVLTKHQLIDGASRWAQGGIAAVLSRDDDIESHVQDTLVAGAGLCHEDAVRKIVGEAPDAIRWLIARGVPFTTDTHSDSGYHLTREGGHSHRRIIHAADATGLAVQTTLEAVVRRHPNITLFENHDVVDLITHRLLGDTAPRVYGCYALSAASGRVESFAAPHVVLATGGAGKVYLYTSNPDTATGDGIAMAWRAGCSVANMEFIQFHPTILFHPLVKSFLITEAVRGEGGRLLLDPHDPNSRFMPQHDPRAELAPRDIVARSIDAEMKRHGLDCVFLDITHRGPAFIKEHFPTIHARCLEVGIDITREPIPVVPAAHYTCGGVVTDLHARTELPGLHAVGEVACTGLHGANRLASNSLLECVVMARAAAQSILQSTAPQAGPRTLPPWDESQVTEAEEEITIAHNWDELRRLMWNYVGIVRSNTRLHQADIRIALLKKEVEEFYARFKISADLL